MYEAGLMAAGGGLGAAGGAGLGELGRSRLLDILAPLDYPRQALWNLVRGGGRLLSGEADLGDLLGAVPGALGAGATALGGPLAGAAVGGLAQGLGRATGSSSFDAATPADLVEQMGGDRDSLMQNLLTGIATDPLTYVGGFGGARAGRAMAPTPSGAGAVGGAGVAGVAAEVPAATGGSLFSAIPDSGNPLVGGGYAGSAPTMSQAEYMRWLASPEAEAKNLAGTAHWAKPALSDEDRAMSLLRAIEGDEMVRAQLAAERAGQPPWWQGVGDNPTPMSSTVPPAAGPVDYSGFVDEMLPAQKRQIIADAARDRWTGEITDLQQRLAATPGVQQPAVEELMSAAVRKQQAAAEAAYRAQLESRYSILDAKMFAAEGPLSRAEYGPRVLDDVPDVARSLNTDLQRKFGILGDYAAEGAMYDLPNQAAFRPTFYSMLRDALASSRAAGRMTGIDPNAVRYGLTEALNAMPGLAAASDTPVMYYMADLINPKIPLAAEHMGALTPRSFGERAQLAELLRQFQAMG